MILSWLMKQSLRAFLFQKSFLSLFFIFLQEETNTYIKDRKELMKQEKRLQKISKKIERKRYFNE